MKKQKRTPIVVGNWKMHPETLKQAESLFAGIKKKATRYARVTTVVCPPLLYAGHILKGYRGASIAFGAQDVFFENKGSYTGAHSPKMLRESGITYTLIGHSERRALGETDAIVARKIVSARSQGLITIVCVGEHERDVEGVYLRTLEKQILNSFEGVSRTRIAKGCIVAYEPLWAIGKKADDALSPEGMQQMALFIKKVLSKKYGRSVGTSMPVLYGGSVEARNVEAILKDGGVEGVLVGHASLVVNDFLEILNTANTL